MASQMTRQRPAGIGMDGTFCIPHRNVKVLEHTTEKLPYHGNTEVLGGHFSIRQPSSGRFKMTRMGGGKGDVIPKFHA